MARKKATASVTEATPAIERVPVGSVHHDPANVRKHPDRNLDAIKGSLARFGQVKPIVVDGDNIVRAGNGTLAAAVALGWQDIDIVRTPLKGSEATAYAIADNRTAELAEWDEQGLAETLRALQSEDFDLGAVGFDAAEVDALIEGLASGLAGGDAAEDPGPQTDRAEELREKWGTASGQLWVIPSLATPGKEHRLLCGDSTKAEDVARVMGGEKAAIVFTSPPYASQREYDQASGFKPIKPDRYSEWFRGVQSVFLDILADDGSYFLNIKEHCDDGQRHLYVKDLTIAHVREWGWMFVDEFCWRDTKNGVPGGWGNRFKDAWEPVFHFARDTKIKFRPLANGTQSSAVFEYSPDTAKTSTGSGLLGVKATEEKEGLARPSNVIECAAASTGGHSAAFPVGLPEFFVKGFTDEGDITFEPFSGSGTTLVACENLGRRCFAVELSPKYVAVALERLAGMGLQPELSR